MLDIDSTPPARTIRAWPASIFSAPELIASIPEAQFLWTVQAGVRTGMPALRAMTRPILAESAGWATLPMITSSTSPAGRRERARTSLTA